MFGTFAGSGPIGFTPPHETYGPAIGDSMVEYKVGPRGYDGGIHNSPFSEGRIKEPFHAPGPFNPFMFMRPRRRRLNLVSIVQVMSLPFIVFALTMYLFGFSVRYNDSKWSWFFFWFCLALSCVFLFKAYLVHKRQKYERWSVPWYLLNDDDSWFFYLGVTVLLSLVLGLVMGDIIFSEYTQNYYTLRLLHTYDKIDPVAEGKAYLDAGAVQFANESFVDTSRAVGYKDGNVWCVAPIKLDNQLVANHDFWAVGKDCCTGFPGDFNCFEELRDRSSAHGALRIVNDEDIPFYKLAVMQANGEFKENSEYLKDGRMNSVNPLFFTWTKDPIRKVDSLWHDAVWTYEASLLVFFIVETAAVIYFAYMYWKNRLWG